MQNCPTFVINLNQDTERLTAIHVSLQAFAWVKMVRVPGIDGSDLPAAACLALTRDPNSLNRRGDLGCFLSHVKAWEAVAKQQDLCLVLEDDAVPHGLGRLQNLVIPDDAELVFVNNRMSVTGAVDAPVNCLPVVSGIRSLNASGRGVGGYGYLLAAQGARKLLGAIGTDLFAGHVDWRMLRYGTTLADLEGDLAGTRCDVIIRTHHNRLLPPQWGVVKAYCLDNSMIIHTARHDSTRLKIGGS